ncbi:MAG: hypothetical protein H8D78_08005 [Chloroflexi bacterium]|nr:hypothetical protein [Chloroflexota bacterium]
MTTAVRERTRLTLDIPPEMKRRLRLLSTQRDLSIRQYVLRVLEDQMRQDLAALAEEEEFLALNGRSDPALAALWDNEKDAAYDRL